MRLDRTPAVLVSRFPLENVGVAREHGWSLLGFRLCGPAVVRADVPSLRILFPFSLFPNTHPGPEGPQRPSHVRP